MWLLSAQMFVLSPVCCLSVVFNRCCLALWSPRKRCVYRGGVGRADCLLWVVTCSLSVEVCLLLVFGVIGRLCSVMQFFPGHRSLLFLHLVF